MSKKRILEFASYAGIGGTQTMLLEFLRHASPVKYEFSVCVLLEHGFLNEEVSKSGIDNTSLNMRGYWDFAAWWKLYRFARDKQFDLIRTYGLKAHIIGRLVGRLLGIPVNITSVRNTDPWRKWYHALLDFLTSGLTDVYISNSEAGRIATHQREHVPLSKIITIPNGIDLSAYTAMSIGDTRRRYRQALGIAPTTPVIGIVANLRQQKGHKTIVDALPVMLEQFPDVKCLFVGEDLLNGEIHQYVQEKQLDQTVIFTGFRPDIPELLSVLDVFLLPSLWEGIPRAILEAMALQKPVVVTAVGGIPEIVEPDQTGIFVPSDDPKALAQAVIFLLTNPDIAEKMGQAGYERVQQFFALDAVVARTEVIYDQLINKKSHAYKP
jgi:glycosyltransferase involved in cell wall biosynthesis